jgi:PAS domain-containing protein
LRCRAWAPGRPNPTSATGLAENGEVRGIDVAAELPDLLPDPVLACDIDGAIVYWSPAAEQTYGYAADEALGRRAATLLQTRLPLPLLEITEELDDLGRWSNPRAPARTASCSTESELV